MSDRATIPILNKLVDAQAMHREHPDTFDAPSDAELAAIKPGDWVKICREGERFWCRIVGAKGKHLIGAIDAPLVVAENADISVPGRIVRFEYRHVYTIMEPPA